ncbi:MAG: patatin-like phospholipase family protein [Candidatus Stygibacter frigidus]|nr:patatin-like phospholipase family protein [Candidatus Stygibacter frigidus]
MKRHIIFLILLVSSIFIYGAGTGLALSGGGARGFAHIGVLKVLDEEGIKIDQIAGTSTGALIASLYACGYSGVEIEEMVLKIDWMALINDQVERKNKPINFKHWQDESNLSLRLQNLTPVLPEGVTPGNGIINELFNLTWGSYATKDFDKLSIPLRIPATDAENGVTKVFDHGNLHEVIFASFCFPTLLQPFKLDESLYIDGGILMNLPTVPLREMGSDIVIGIKTNSALKEPDEIQGILDVLEQTASVAMQSNIKSSLEDCDIIIEPDLSEFGMLRFDAIKEIIDAGEKAARAGLPQLKSLARHQDIREKKIEINKRVAFKRIKIEGNKYLKRAEILTYLGLKTRHSYSKAQISTAFRQAYNTDLFQMIYPVIRREDDDDYLIVKIEERHRSYVKMNLSYNITDNISMRLISDHKNSIQPNSRLIGCLEIGKNNKFCLDFIKNFGNDFGLYYHLFPYISEIPIYTYDSDFTKLNSVETVETGFTDGLGLFFHKSLILEFYNFYYSKKIYRDIGSNELNEPYFRSWGAGAKVYFETLDDLVFGMKGMKLISKYTIAKSDDDENERYQKSLFKFEMLHPLTNHLSFRYKFEYGSYFNKAIPYDPFYIGGMDSFLGLHEYDRSSSVYKINSASLRLNPYKKLYVEVMLNNLNLGYVDNWEFNDQLDWAGGLIIGYKFPLIPVSVAIAFNENDEACGYINIGYEMDVFEFSRK